MKRCNFQPIVEKLPLESAEIIREFQENEHTDNENEEELKSINQTITTSYTQEENVKRLVSFNSNESPEDS